MANYYNVRAWKHTGFDYMNRPYSRSVLQSDYFTSAGNYITMQGITTNRDDMFEITQIDLQGSVKDLRGTQINEPNMTGSQGLNGAWYSWEEVDYLALIRTGYPGDEDFIDISGNLDDPWNAPPSGGKRIRVAYYFVVGLEQRARNVTRLTLSCDMWTTLGGADELTIQTGYKIRGHITDAEDASSYNTASEGIGLIEPLSVISNSKYSIGNGVFNIYASATNLVAHDRSEEFKIDAIAARDPEGNSVTIPSITISENSLIEMVTPEGSSGARIAPQYGIYNANSDKVEYNAGLLYSLGQFDLLAAYTVPADYVDATLGPNIDFIETLKNKTATIQNPTSRDIGTYPRKADYMFGTDAILGCLSGDLCIKPYYEVSDRSIYIWADVSPGGSPIARFKSIKEHPYLFDSIVKGAPWNNYSVVQQGASGSFWNAISLSSARASNELTRLQNQNEYNYNVAGDTWGRYWRGVAQGTNEGFATDDMGQTFGGALYTRAGDRALSGQASYSSIGGVPVLGALTRAADKSNKADIDYYFKVKSQQLESTNDLINYYKGTVAAPSVEFQAGTGVYTYDVNTFLFYTVNTGSKDRERLKNYFRRYGYSGQYAPLTWSNIHVKNKVNYIEAEGALLTHEFYPMRATSELSTLLAEGLFLWDEKPNADAFANQSDA